MDREGRMDRAALIQRKGEVQAEIARLRRQVEAMRARGDARRLAELERQLDAAMAEEARLRQAIDRSR